MEFRQTITLGYRLARLKDHHPNRTESEPRERDGLRTLGGWLSQSSALAGLQARDKVTLSEIISEMRLPLI